MLYLRPRRFVLQLLCSADGSLAIQRDYLVPLFPADADTEDLRVHDYGVPSQVFCVSDARRCRCLVSSAPVGVFLHCLLTEAYLLDLFAACSWDEVINPVEDYIYCVKELF